jgi:hypothetical protein
MTDAWDESGKHSQTIEELLVDINTTGDPTGELAEILKAVSVLHDHALQRYKRASRMYYETAIEHLA